MIGFISLEITINKLSLSFQVPEINAHAIEGSKLIANPNCTTAIAAVVLHPIIKEFGIKKIIMSTYQAASGAGAEVQREQSFALFSK